jgi:glutamate N-acetyltransferase/amino-acid N-acetyltransferase
MSETFQIIEGSVTAPRGFRAAGVFCDIKRLGKGTVTGRDGGPKRDLMLIAADRPAAVAGMFTTNQVCAAPVKVSLRHARKARAQAIVANSGNANACTGEQGMRDAEAMVRAAAQALGLPEHDVLVCSTGRIGLPMPMDRVASGIRAAAGELSGSRAAAAHAAEAILTSDSVAKEIAVRFRLGGKHVTIGGIAKGAGMIEPGMSPTGRRPAAQPLHATMLAFITSDAAIDPRALKQALREAVAVSFNRITVDGDMSTNDTVLALANGMAENATIRSLDGRDGRRFQQALNRVCLELARKMVADGEGDLRREHPRQRRAQLATPTTRRAGRQQRAGRPAGGGDPNWGRIMDALGYSPARIVEEKVDLGYSAPGSRDVTWSLRRGLPTRVDFATLCACVAPAEFDLHIRLNLGQGEAVVHACDLSEAYVVFNKGDVSDPAALGG